MDDTKSFIASTEATVKAIMRDQAKRSESEARRARVRRRKGEDSKTASSNVPPPISRADLNSAYGGMIVRPPTSELSSLPQIKVMKKQHSNPNSNNNNNHRSDKRRNKKRSNIHASPLFKSLSTENQTAFKTRMEETNALGALLSGSSRPGHAVEKRMCNACWAQPNKRTGCDHVLSLSTSKVQSSLELQGPTSWNTSDLRLKYRDAVEREKVYDISVRMQAEAAESEAAMGIPKSVPIVSRHPIHSKLMSYCGHESRLVVSNARRRNLKKVFVLSVHRVWLTNLDYVCNSSSDDSRGLCNRRDDEAIQHGNSQLQSVSSERALAAVANLEETSSKLIMSKEAASLNTDDIFASASMLEHREKVSKKNAITPTTTIPLSVSVCGRMEFINQVPGTTFIGRHGLWFTNPNETREDADRTVACAMFLRNSVLSSSNNILVLLSLAIEITILSPVLRAWVARNVIPEDPVVLSILMELPTLIAPTIYVDCNLETTLDDVMPPSTKLISGFETHVEDYFYTAECTRVVTGALHRTEESKSSRKFVTYQLTTTLEHDFTTSSQAFGVTEKSATPNITAMSGRFSWHSSQRVLEALSRTRTSRDYLYVGMCNVSHGSNDPNIFTLRMEHETIRHIIPTNLLNYEERIREKEAEAARQAQLREIENKIKAGTAALAAKRAEAERVAKNLEAAAEDKGRRKIPSAVTQEWEERVRNSDIAMQHGLWQERVDRESGIKFYVNMNEQLAERFFWSPPSEWPTTTEEDESNDDVESVMSDSTTLSSVSATSNATTVLTDEIELLVEKLTENQNFLQALKSKLGIEEKKEYSSSEEDDDDDRESDISSASEDEQEEEIEGLMREKRDLNIPSLALKKAKKKANYNPGEGWKRLKASAVPKGFVQRAYKTNTEGPTSDYLNAPNAPAVVGMLDPADSENFRQPEDIPSLRAQFIADITADTEKRRNLVDRITHEHGSKEVAEDVFAKRALEVENADKASENAAHAIVCTRSDNLEGLEEMLDENVDVNETRDANGNTLFLIACQQGHKRIVKHLLRRQADMNAQNYSGNTGLHYCFEYKNTKLANYLLDKGADDSIVNVDGLTCYEGINSENLENI